MDEKVSQLIDLALVEDIGSGDVTAKYFVPEAHHGRAFLVARSDGIVCGTEIAAEVFCRVDPGCDIRILPDGSGVAPGDRPGGDGKARSLLTAERTALNFIQRLSGVATRTGLFVGRAPAFPSSIPERRHLMAAS